MKIIEISQDWKEPTFEEVTVKCTSCGSKLSIEAEDINEYNNGLYFECPVCCNNSKLDKNIEYKYCCISSYNKYCIPYNDDTKHILNTTNLPPEYYRYWED